MQNQLASKALLCTLKTGAWRATKLNRNETEKVNDAHHSGNVAKVTVRLSDHVALSSLGKLHAEARTAHYRLTLPSVDDGVRMLPVGRELEHSKIMTEFGNRHSGFVRDFLADYSDERDTAPARLNGLYVASQWPDPTEVGDKFSFTTRYLPVPEIGTWQTWLAESAEAGKEELRERLAVAIRHVADKLKIAHDEPGGTFRDSLVGNLKDIISLAPDLNLANDPQIAQIIQEADELARHNPEALRDDATTRKAVADKAAQICKAFNL